jgi:small subunit ribosomal protein S9
VDILLEPLRVVGQEKAYDISVHVNGGGITGQRDAIKLGVARALLKIDPDMRPALKKEKFLTRDARVKERKKPGLKRARKAPTYTKR